MKTRTISILLAAVMAVLLAACVQSRFPQSDYQRGYSAGVDAFWRGWSTGIYDWNRDNPEWTRGFDDGYLGIQYRMHGEGGGR